MTAFARVPGAAELAPVKLVSAVRRARRTYRDLGLVGTGAPPEATLRARAQRLEVAVSSAVQLAVRDLRQLRQVVPWLAGRPEGYEGLLDHLLAHLEDTGQPLPLRTAATLAEFRPESRASIRWMSSKRPTPLVLDPKRTPSAIVELMATNVLRAGIPIGKAVASEDLTPGSPYAAALLHLLTTEPLSPWLWTHSESVLTQFLAIHSLGPLAGRLTNALLSPIAAGAVEPGDVSRGKPLADIIGVLDAHLPTRQATSAWREVGPEVRELLRWWRVQRDLDEAFKNWNAEPEREAFWYRYIPSIRDVHAFPSVATITIRIGGFWFVEVGRTGFATYVFPHSEWQRLSTACRRATKPEQVRAHQRGRVDRFIHNPSPGWEPKFHSAILDLTGEHPK